MERVSDRPTGRVLRLSNLPRGADSAHAGGPAFVAYCSAGEVRAEIRRKSITRAAKAHRRAIARTHDPYPTALLLCQRLGVALEDLARLVVGLEALGTLDPFSVLRNVRLDDLDGAFERLANDPEGFRAAVRLPTPEATEELNPELRDALLAVSDALARRWHGQWRRCAGGWRLLSRLAKAMRHGSPLLPRELVLGPPGAGALGEGLADIYERWVLLVDTAVETPQSFRTEYAMGDLSEDTLARAQQAGLEAVALSRELAAAHVHRIHSESKWAIPNDALRLATPQQRRILRQAKRD